MSSLVGSIGSIDGYISPFKEKARGLAPEARKYAGA